MKLVDALFEKLGYIRASSVKASLNYYCSVGKRLDEHREEVEAIQQETNLFDNGNWHSIHMATQDDYLMRLYHLVHGCWPDDKQKLQTTGEYVRPRPAILGHCDLPDQPRSKKAISSLH